MCRQDQLSSLLDAVEAGQAVVITRRGKPVAELVPRCTVRDLLPQLAALRASLPEQSTDHVLAEGRVGGVRRSIRPYLDCAV